MSYGWCSLEGGSRVEVHHAEDWAWIEIARREGKAYVVSRADRFHMPPDYFCAYAADWDELARVKAGLRGELTDILAVYWVDGEPHPVQRALTRWSDAVRRLITPAGYGLGIVDDRYGWSGSASAAGCGSSGSASSP